MPHRKILIVLAVLSLLAAGCSQNSGRLSPADDHRAAAQQTPLGVALVNDGLLPRFGPIAPTVIDLRQVPRVGEQDPASLGPIVHPERGGPHKLLSEERVAELRKAAALMPPNPRIQDPTSPATRSSVHDVVAGFEAIESSQCCTAGVTVPPDPELSAGTSHLIAAVNVAFEIYDKAGAVTTPATTFSAFFTGVPGCGGLFDPNTLYDESADRYMLGVDAGGSGYCIAVSQTGDPNGLWNAYSFTTATGGDFFDYPHAGVGEDAIFMASNTFLNAGGVRGDIWAIDKAAMYAGASLPLPIARNTGVESTPQPMNLHGFAQGTWPSTGRHYILTDDQFNGNTFGVWAWDDPFGTNVLTDLGTVDLAAASGVNAGFPGSVPQMGGGNIAGNDWRVEDAEYRGGHIWSTQTIACNPGAGTVNCVRWVEIDPTGPTAVQAGVIGSDGEYRSYSDVAANHRGDMTIGYTKSSTTSLPSVYFTGRFAQAPAGTVQPEVLLKAGEVVYTSFGSDPPPHRWGDYTGATSDPDGDRTWYLGEYSENNGVVSPWGTYIGGFSTQDVFADGFESGSCILWSSSSPPC